MEKHAEQLNAHYLAEIDNILTASLWLASQHNFSDRMLLSYCEQVNYYCQRTHQYELWQSHFREICGLLQEGDASEESDYLVTQLQARIALADLYLNNYDKAETQLRKLLQKSHRKENATLISASASLLSKVRHPGRVTSLKHAN